MKSLSLKSLPFPVEAARPMLESLHLGYLGNASGKCVSANNLFHIIKFLLADGNKNICDDQIKT